MKTLFTLQLIALTTIYSFAQKTKELNFMDNLKLSKWRSTESFSDSTLTHNQVFHLIPTTDTDTISSTPILWISVEDSLTIEYYKFNSEVQTSTDRIVRYVYSFDSKKNLLTIIPKNPTLAPVVFKAKVIRPRKMLELSRVQAKK